MMISVWSLFHFISDEKLSSGKGFFNVYCMILKCFSGRDIFALHRKLNLFVLKGKTCGDPGTPRNGKRSGLSFTFQDTVHYSCNNCYKLTGAGYRQCLGDTTWTGSLPTCTRKYRSSFSTREHHGRQKFFGITLLGSYWVDNIIWQF